MSNFCFCGGLVCAQILMYSGTVVFEIYAVSLAIVSFGSCKECDFFLTNSYHTVLRTTNN